MYNPERSICYRPCDGRQNLCLEDTTSQCTILGVDVVLSIVGSITMITLTTAEVIKFIRRKFHWAKKANNNDPDTEMMDLRLELTSATTHWPGDSVSGCIILIKKTCSFLKLEKECKRIYKTVAVAEGSVRDADLFFFWNCETNKEIGLLYQHVDNGIYNRLLRAWHESNVLTGEGWTKFKNLFSESHLLQRIAKWNRMAVRIILHYIDLFKDILLATKIGSLIPFDAGSFYAIVASVVCSEISKGFLLSEYFKATDPSMIHKITSAFFLPLFPGLLLYRLYMNERKGK